MLYFDFSATTPADTRVLEAFAQAAKTYGNYNSVHRAGRAAKEQIDAATDTVRQVLHAEGFEIIYTSGASESNNLAIKGYCGRFQSGHIITTRFEHSSTMSPVSELQRKGFRVDFVNTAPSGVVDLAHLRSLIRKDTVLFSMALVSSELGYAQPLKEIGELLRNIPQVKLHVDATQAVGKIEFDPAYADFVSLSAHKFYGVKGVGLLLKKDGLTLFKQIGGGHSVSPDRSGTPSGELIVSMAKALELVSLEGAAHRARVEQLRKRFKDGIRGIPNLVTNNPGAIPHIVNLSLLYRASRYTQSYLDEQGICVSTGSACSSSKYSPAVFAFTNSMELAASSFRISLSHLNTEEEVDTLVEKLKDWASE